MIKLFGLDWKSQLKKNGYLIFICSCQIVQKTCKNRSEMNKNIPKYPLFYII